jgi:hypothetical protein
VNSDGGEKGFSGLKREVSERDIFLWFNKEI